jgi:hypothetical protein
MLVIFAIGQEREKVKKGGAQADRQAERTIPIER